MLLVMFVEILDQAATVGLQCFVPKSSLPTDAPSGCSALGLAVLAVPELLAVSVSSHSVGC